MPAVAVESGNTFFFGLLMFTLLIAGLDSAVGFAEATVTNIIDATGWSRKKVAAGVFIGGVILTTLFTSNWGWVLFDLVDHYISLYIVFSVGLMQCIAVGWIFEREQTSLRSLEHAKSMRALSVMYWFPVIVITFYASFGFPEAKGVGVILIVVFTFIAFIVSYKMSKLTFNEWYHEIVMCGTDKIAMSITILSNSDGSRSWWMIPFEAYFGLLIKFVNPACLLFFIFEGLAQDLSQPYGITTGYMPMFASIYLFIAIFIIFAPMMMCSYPEMFMHNVEKEFCADDIYEIKNRANARLKKTIQKKMAAPVPAEGNVELASNAVKPTDEDKN